MSENLKVNKLLVSWQSPVSKRNYFVGILKKDNEGYMFKYNNNFVEDAKKEGFTPFIGLNDLNKIYRSIKLFSVFERRLPSKNRNIFKMVVREHQLDNSNDVDWEYLRITKGQLATDSLSFLEPIIICGNKIHYKGEVAGSGWTFTMQNNRMFSMGDPLALRIEPTNIDDTKAVEV
ncbi:hypothetical protein [Neobacillus sp. Marseille-QA0830]